jgi:antitoxin StbD
VRANGEAVAVLNHNRVMAYMVPANVYEAILDRLDNLYLARIIKSRSSEKGGRVDINDL